MATEIPITFEQLAAKHADLELDFAAFKKKVAEMLDCQQKYFKSNKDYQLLKTAKALEAEVRELITPKPVKVSQASMEFLGL